MSFEGYFQFLCPRGHYYIEPTDCDIDSTCPACGEKAKLEHLVDNTNCDGVEAQVEAESEYWVECRSKFGTIYKVPEYTYEPRDRSQWRLAKGT